MGTRKIIQITSTYCIADRRHTNYENKDYYTGETMLVALCDDGTVWKFDEPTKCWYELPRTGIDPEGERIEGKSL